MFVRMANSVVVLFCFLEGRHVSINGVFPLAFVDPLSLSAAHCRCAAPDTSCIVYSEAWVCPCMLLCTHFSVAERMQLRVVDWLHMRRLGPRHCTALHCKVCPRDNDRLGCRHRGWLRVKCRLQRLMFVVQVLWWSAIIIYISM